MCFQRQGSYLPALLSALHVRLTPLLWLVPGKSFRVLIPSTRLLTCHRLTISVNQWLVNSFISLPREYLCFLGDLSLRWAQVFRIDQNFITYYHSYSKFFHLPAKSVFPSRHFSKGKPPFSETRSSDKNLKVSLNSVRGCKQVFPLLEI